jgi:glycosyltransferase involved in cell wall biosynthesis
MLAQALLRLVYVLRTFPRLSESFVLREVAELARRGEGLTIWSLVPQPVAEAALELPPGLGALVCEPPRGWRRPAALAASTAAAFARAPLLALSALGWSVAWALRERDPRQLAAFPFGAYLSRQISPETHLHAHFANTPATVALLAAWLAGCRFSFSGHARDLFAATSPSFLAAKLRRAAFAAVETDYSRRRVLSMLSPDEHHKVLVVRNGIVGSALPAPGDRREDLVLAVARLVPKKGLDLLVEAVARLSERGVPASLELLGDGPERSRLAELAERHGVSDRVELAGAADRAQVDAALARASVFALPCRRMPDGDEDGLPVAILEALAAGLPVVSTPVAGIPEAVRPEHTGVLVPQEDAGALADALERILGDAALRERLGQGGAALVAADFDLERNVDRLEQRFRDVAAGARASAISPAGGVGSSSR